MGESSQFKSGDKAPNNGVYMEVGETGSSVEDPLQISMEAGDTFPETKNKDRVWKNKRRQSRQSPQNSRHTS